MRALKSSAPPSIRSQRSKPSVRDLIAPTSARFYQLDGKKLTSKFVRELFSQLLLQQGSRRVGAASIRQQIGKSGDEFVHSFVCFRTDRPVPFLLRTKLKERHYGYVLLVERSGYLGVFVRGLSGVDSALAHVVKTIPRQKLLHAWGNVAKYQKLGTRRMAMGDTELSSASYEAPDLESALPTSIASRSIPHLIRARTNDATIAITPSTGRVRKAGDKADVFELVEWMDEFCAELNACRTSDFLSAFCAAIELKDLPPPVRPTGILFDFSKLHRLLTDPDAPWQLRAPANSTADILALLGEVLTLHPDSSNAKRWIAASGANRRAVLKQLTDRYQVVPDVAKGWILERNDGAKIGLDEWIRIERAFSVSYSVPEYFYAFGSLYHRAGFSSEAKRVRAMLKVLPELDAASSEKGPTDSYDAGTTRFSADSIFRILEEEKRGDHDHLCCGDVSGRSKCTRVVDSKCTT